MSIDNFTRQDTAPGFTVLSDNTFDLPHHNHIFGLAENTSTTIIALNRNDERFLSDSLGHALVYNAHQTTYTELFSVVRTGLQSYSITMKANPGWLVIQNNLASNETAQDRSDLVASVFLMKFKTLLNEILTNTPTNSYITYVYILEFQKRGLPHGHIILKIHNLRFLPSSPYTGLAPSMHLFDNALFKLCNEKFGKILPSFYKRFLAANKEALNHFVARVQDYNKKLSFSSPRTNVSNFVSSHIRKDTFCVGGMMPGLIETPKFQEFYLYNERRVTQTDEALKQGVKKHVEVNSTPSFMPLSNRVYDSVLDKSRSNIDVTPYNSQLFELMDKARPQGSKCSSFYCGQDEIPLYLNGRHKDF